MNKLALLSIVLLSITLPIKAEINKILTTTYISVEAPNISLLKGEVKKDGPKYDGKSVWALLRWDLTVEYVVRTKSDGCYLQVEELQVDADITIPDWVNVNLQNNSEQLWWKDFTNFIIDHENKHYQNVVNEANQLYKKLVDSQGFESCHLARLFYVESKSIAIDKIRRVDFEIDVEAKRFYSSNNALFEPLKSEGGGIVIESGFMKSFIGI